MNKSYDSEKTYISIERSRVTIASKLSKVGLNLMGVLNGWHLLCANLIVLSVISFTIVLYLKLLGELTPFCLCDNWYYFFYYLIVVFVSTALIPLSDFALIAPDSRFWRWCRRLGAYGVFEETEAFLYFLFFYNDIAYEVEFDDKAVVLVWGLSTVGVIRCLTLSMAYYIGNNYLKRVQHFKALPVKYFGNTYTDWMDILVIESLLFALYYYPFSIYSLGLVLSISFLYILFIRF